MARRPIHRDATNPPFNAFEGFVSGVLAGGAAFVPLLVFQVNDRWGEVPLLVWLVDRLPLAATYVAAAVAVSVAVAARYQPHVAVWVGVGVIAGFPIALVVFALVDMSLNPGFFG